MPGAPNIKKGVLSGPLFLCLVHFDRKLFVTRGGYYAWKNRQKSPWQLNNEELLEKIIEVHQANREVYGYPRVYEALQKRGELAGRNRITRLMRDNGIKARMAKKFRKHSHRHHLITDPHNLLLQQEPSCRANKVLVGDVTYIRVGKDWNYLCTVMDLHTRQIIGWHFAKNVNAKLLQKSLRVRPKVGLNLPVLEQEQQGRYRP